MKKLLILSSVFLFLSCGVSKTVRESRKVIKGTWTLNEIKYSKTGTYAVTLFNDASKICFEGSTWNFIPNNSTGTYTISRAACENGQRDFIFTIQEINEVTSLYDFLLKPLDENGNNENNIGFRLQLTKLTDDSMQWQQTLTVDGAPFLINMNFTKL